MKRYTALLLAMVLLLCAACTAGPSQPAEAEPIRVGVLTDGDAIDRGINQQIWNALDSLAEEGMPLQRSYRVPGTDGSYDDCIAALAAEGSALILCAQGSMSDVILHRGVIFKIIVCYLVLDRNRMAIPQHRQ